MTDSPRDSQATKVPAQNTTDNTPDASKNSAAPARDIFDRLETYLKLIAGVAVIAAAMGYPAVYMQYSRLKIPTEFISYGQVLRAGFLPTVALAVVGIYAYGVIKGTKASTKSTDLTMFHLLMLPLSMSMQLPLWVMVIILVVGVLSGGVLIFLAPAWVIVEVAGLSLTNHELLYLAALLFLAAIGLLVRIYLKRLPLEFRLHLPNPQYRSVGDLEHFDIYGFLHKWILLPIVVLSSATLGLLYSLKAVLFIWNPHISTLLENKHILVLGFGTAIAVTLLNAAGIAVGVLTVAKNESARLKALLGLVSTLLILYFASAGLYSYLLYPNIPQGLGGGKPAPVIFWLYKGDLPPNLIVRLSNAKFIDEGEVIRGENIYLIYADSEIIIVSDNLEPPSSGSLLPRDKVKAISW